MKQDAIRMMRYPYARQARNDIAFEIVRNTARRMK